MKHSTHLSGLLLTLGLAATGPVLAQPQTQTQTTVVTTTTQVAAPANLPAYSPNQSPEIVERAMLDGIAFAKAQLAAGRYETMRIGPTPTAQENAYINAVQQQGVSVVPAGDTMSEALMAYVDANNAIMQAAIRQRFGNDFWERVDRMAPMPGPAMGR